MSTKTVTKRVALATVVALGAGVLSLVSVTSANAASLATQANRALAGGITIDTSTPNTVGWTPSVGLLATGLTTVGTGTTTEVITATVLSTGSLEFQAGGAATGGYYTVSAGGYFTNDTLTVSNINGGQTSDSATATAGATGQYRGIAVAFNGAAGSTVTINGYTDSTKGTLTTALTVTIAGSSVSGVASATKSYIVWNWQQGAGLGLTSDFSTGSATTTGNALYLQIDLNDAYGAPLTSTTGALTVAATSGANVGLSGAADSPVASSGTYSTAVSASAPGDIYAKITEATAGAGWSGTVTVTYNGVVLATKSGSITGLPSKITIAPLAVAKTNATTDTAVSYQVYDSVGNAIALASSAVVFNASDNTAAVTSTGTGSYPNGNSTTAAGYLSVVGGTSAGVANISVKTTLSNGTVVVSNTVPVTVGGVASSYTASLDKTKYAPGDIATLKVKFLDSKGNAAASSSTLYTIPTNAAPFVWNAALTLPQFTQIGTSGAVAGNQGANVYGVGANVSPDATGTITLKYTVGTTEASYSGVVDFPTVDAVAGSAQTVSYSVSSGSTSLNDVLKGIVSLIASINKQIAALAKLVTKK
jgi:hypothetical protein